MSQPSARSGPLQRPAIRTAMLVVIGWAAWTAPSPNSHLPTRLQSNSGAEQTARRIDSDGPLSPSVKMPLMKIELNDASIRELGLLPSVGPNMAARIQGHRQQKGSFQSWDDFSTILGMGPSTIETIDPWCEIDQTESAFYRSDNKIEPPLRHITLDR
ncbi:ComEA family DNA-binding protein [Rhodopirellula sp. SWK7]|uniref:ComEA family DNA-binding protein n=1 Tax=Rhodopirellula sp. SWK7 TaxID=595460 RepID=UPI001360B4F3|nr:helix-hairpin-helix domain-containing protein [Rhodopirellula sp. SWK7]